jgi:hypothetical protein
MKRKSGFEPTFLAGKARTLPFELLAPDRMLPVLSHVPSRRTDAFGLLLLERYVRRAHGDNRLLEGEAPCRQVGPRSSTRTIFG